MHFSRNHRTHSTTGGQYCSNNNPALRLRERTTHVKVESYLNAPPRRCEAQHTCYTFSSLSPFSPPAPPTQILLSEPPPLHISLLTFSSPTCCPNEPPPPPRCSLPALKPRQHPAERPGTMDRRRRGVPPSAWSSLGVGAEEGLEITSRMEPF